jgi:hypothetical protein
VEEFVLKRGYIVLLGTALLGGGCAAGDACVRSPQGCPAETTTGAGGSTGTGGAGGGTGGGGAGGGMGTGACGSYVPPAVADLTANPKLPDPFLGANGARITTKDQWACRRAEIGAQAQQYELGANPGKPETVTGAFAAGTLTVTVTNAGKSISFPATITLPTTGTAPYPAMIGIGGISLGAPQILAMGVATVIFPNDMVAAQQDGSSRGKGMFFDLYGSSGGAGAMIAWAWGVSRLIDAIETTPAAGIDSARLGVTGCSRNGKGALIVGAFDERIALTIPQESGSGGAASWRVSDAQKVAGANIQTLGEITGENVWFRSSFSQFNAAATKLPFDHHMIEGLVAPRALFVIENSIDWLGPVSTFQDSMAAHTVWEALGIPDHMGYSEVGNHNHCSFPSSQTADLQAFVKKFLVGNGTDDTAVLKNDLNMTFDQAAWVDWTVPTLQ